MNLRTAIELQERDIKSAPACRGVNASFTPPGAGPRTPGRSHVPSRAARSSIRWSLAVLAGLFLLIDSACALEARVAVHRGTPKLYVDGHIVAPLIFFNNVTHPDASTVETGWREIRYAVDAGYELHSTGIRHALTMPWPRPGEQPDYRGVRQTMDDFLRLAPAGKLILRIDTDPPAWWSEDHPDEGIHNEQGEPFGRVSAASMKWRNEAESILRRLVRFLEAHYGDHVLGYHPCGQGHLPGSCEWIHPAADYGPAMRDGFREWVRHKYGGDASALHRAWLSTAEDFDSLALPSATERAAFRHGVFRDPVVQRKAMDYQEYLQICMVEVLERFARAVKEETGRRKCVVLFYGYLFEIGSGSGHHRLSRILRCPDIDILCAPISYVDRTLAGTAPFMTPVDSIHLHGKLWSNEDDTRTHLSAPDMGFGRVSEPDHTKWVLQRNFAHAFAHRTGAWWMTSGTRGWFDSEELWRDLGALLRHYKQRIDDVARYESDIAVIIDEESALHTEWNVGTRDLLYNSRSDLHRIGAPIGLYLLDDLIAGKVPEAKLYVFLNAFYVSPQRRRAIRSAVCRDGKTVVWYYAPGYLAESAGTANMEALTGITLHKLPAPIVPRLACTGSGAGLRKGHRIMPGAGVVLDPAFAAEEPQKGMTVLGRYARADDAAGFVIKKERDWTSVFVGSTRLPPRALRHLAAEAGVHVWLDTNDLVIGDGSFLAVHAARPGRKVIRLPTPGKVTDAISGRQIATEASRFQIKMQYGETRMFLIEP